MSSLVGFPEAVTEDDWLTYRMRCLDALSRRKEFGHMGWSGLRARPRPMTTAELIAAVQEPIEYKGMDDLFERVMDRRARSQPRKRWSPAKFYNSKSPRRRKTG